MIYYFPVQGVNNVNVKLDVMRIQIYNNTRLIYSSQSYKSQTTLLRKSPSRRKARSYTIIALIISSMSYVLHPTCRPTT